MKNSLLFKRCCSTILALYSLLAVVAQPGTSDLTYYGGKGVDYKCTGGLVLPDSSLIVTGKFAFVNQKSINGIVHLSADGELDNNFNTGSGANDHINVVARQRDGKLIIGGDFITYNGQTKNRIARLDTDGNLDGTFQTGTGTDGSVYTIYVDHNGKILIGGVFDTYNGQPAGGIVRLNTDGTRDTSFQSNGGFNGDVYSIDLQADKKIIVAGIFSAYNTDSVSCIARLDSTGILDNTFNTGGSGANNVINNATVLANGKIIAAGFFTTYNGSTASRIARINSDGSLDAGFVTGSGFNNNVNELTVQPDGKILFTGNFTQYKGAAANRIIRLDTTGNKDISFNPGAGPNLSCNAVFLNPDGRVYVGGTFSLVDNFARLCLARLNANGSVDQSFFSDSKLNGQINALGFQKSGKAIVGGQFTKYNQTIANRIARLNINGTLDTSFIVSPGAGNIVRSVAVLSDDKILVAGDFTTYNGSSAGRIVRLQPNGTIDNTFTTGTGANNAIYKVEVLSSGKILITGNFTSYNGTAVNRIARLNSDGTLDNTFAVGSGLSNTGRDISVQPDGKILLAGSFTTYNGFAAKRVVRLDSAGNYDNTFATGSGANNTIYAVALQADGSILLGGMFTLFNGVSKSRIVRLTSTGTVDNTYMASVSGQINEIYPVGASGFSTGGMLVAGAFTTINGVAKNRIAMLDNNGVLDTLNYYTASGADGSINAIIHNTVERKFLIGGDFKAYDAHIANRLAAVYSGYIQVENAEGPLCPGAVLPLYFTKAETFFGNNNFTVQMSDATGNFANAVAVGTQTSVDEGLDSVMVSIPLNTTTGDGYRFRIISSNPADTSNLTMPVTISSQLTSTATASGSTTFCGNQPLTITASAGREYLWSNGDTTHAISVNTSGTYQVTVSFWGCQAPSNSISVTVLTAPDTSITVGYVSICNGGTLSLSAEPGLTYAWSNTQTDSTILVTQTGTYTVTVSNGSCTAINSVYADLSIYNTNLITTTDSLSFCTGGVARLLSIPGFNYLWSNGATTPAIQVTSSGVYDVTVNDGTCFDTSSAIQVTVYDLPAVTFPPLAPVCAGQTPFVILNQVSPASGVFSGSSFISNDTLYVADYYAQFGNTPLTVSYTVTNSNNCSGTATSQQTFTICTDIEKTVANSISVSPNPAVNNLTVNSNANDLKEIEVFNLLGQMVINQRHEGMKSRMNIDISALAAGTYFLKTGSQTFRFIKK